MQWLKQHCIMERPMLKNFYTNRCTVIPILCILCVFFMGHDLFSKNIHIIIVSSIQCQYIVSMFQKR